MLSHFFDKSHLVNQPKTPDIALHGAGRGFGEAGDLSTTDSCLYSGGALKAFADEQPFLQGDTYTDSKVSILLAPARQEIEKSRKRVQAKFAKAGCK